MSAAPNIEMAAADWFALKRSGEMTAQQLVDFQEWLEASPEHQLAWEEAEQSWAMAGLLRDDPELLLLRGQARKTYPPFRRPLVAAGAAAAMAAAVFAGVVAAPTVTGQGTPLLRGEQQTFRTGVGQRTTVTLADGSVVTLDTDTILRTSDRGRERRMYLDRGRAYFKVARDPTRPFVVAAAGRTVTALGTAFDVRVGPGQFEVTLVEGKVRVEQPRALLKPSQAADLKAGYQIEATSAREWVVKPADVVRDTGWVQGRLSFVDQPLAEVAAEMNRYSERKIVLADAGIGREPVVAVFRPGDMEAFVKMVRSYKLARVTETEDTIELTPLTPSRQ
ncbi:MAG TPA: FecR domain-containing protein [Caulobacteraceae bacterium]|nr:FecR domain-containing protein [Caulobacteraceae bacterium]